MAFLDAERTAGKKVFPPADEIYAWSQYCAFEDVRVVILGQDPYHNDGQAHGCAFSVRPGVPVPPSLANMYKELETSVPGFTRPPHGYLKAWCTQGQPTTWDKRAWRLYAPLYCVGLCAMDAG
jgi:uracil-DNA glycosylase